MKLLTIYPIQSCNLNCEACPSKKWVYPVDSDKNKINNEMLLKWIDKYLDPNEWMIELTGGGEPGMYPEIDELIKGLDKRGYYGLVKTNGTLPLPKTEHFLRIAAWHQIFDVEHPPKYYDEIIIIANNPNDDWEGKIKYCKEHSIPYQTFQYIPFHLPAPLRSPKQHEPIRINKFITDWCVIYSGGNIVRCFPCPTSENITIQNMSEPQLKSIEKDCPYCSNVAKFERFMPKEWINMFTK